MHATVIALCKAPISFLLDSQQHGTAMAARIGAAKVQGFRKGYLVDSLYIYGLRSTLSCSIVCNPRVSVVLRATPTRRRRGAGPRDWGVSR